VPAALIVGLLQLLIPADGNRGGWPGKRPAEATATSAASPERRQASLSESTGESAEPRRPPLPDPRPPASSAGLADGASAAAPIPARVFIHHTVGARNALPAIQLAAYLQTRGFAVTDIRAVDVEIERPSVRFFFDGDRPEGRRLVDAIGTFFANAPGQAPHEAADLSHFSPKPRRGIIEVWLPATGADASHST